LIAKEINIKDVLIEYRLVYCV